MSVILAVAAALLAIGLLVRLFVTMSPAALARVFKIVGFLFAIAVLVALTWAGRLPHVLGAFVPLILIYLRYFRGGFNWRRQPTPGRKSEVDTATLHMELDHDSGQMGGSVRQGPHAGRALEDLSLDELLELLEFCRDQDAESVPVLEAWLDRSPHAGWRERAAGEAGESGAAEGEWSGAMTRDQALEILGLPPGADEDAIREAHRRLMRAAHPDRGGSTFLAAQINRAKDVLLGR